MTCNYKMKRKRKSKSELGVLPIVSTLPHAYAGAKTIGSGMSKAAVNRDPGATIKYGSSGMLLAGVVRSMRPVTNFMVKVFDSTSRGLGVKKKYTKY